MPRKAPHDIPPPEIWVPLTDPVKLKIIAKTQEELNECGKVLSRIVQQNETGINLAELQNEISDVLATFNLCIVAFSLDRSKIKEREQVKINYHIKRIEELLDHLDRQEKENDPTTTHTAA